MSAISSYQPVPVLPLDYDIRFNKDLTWGEKVFLAELKSLCAGGKCPYHQADLAKLLNVCTVSIHNWAKKLCDLGYIEIFSDSEDAGKKQFIRMKDKTAS